MEKYEVMERWAEYVEELYKDENRGVDDIIDMGQMENEVYTICSEEIVHGITEDMTSKMDERRKWKSKNDEHGRQRYRQLNNELRREAAKAKEEWWSKECAELEELDSKGRSDLV